MYMYMYQACAELQASYLVSLLMLLPQKQTATRKIGCYLKVSKKLPLDGWSSNIAVTRAALALALALYIQLPKMLLQDLSLAEAQCLLFTSWRKVDQGGSLTRLGSTSAQLKDILGNSASTYK